MKNSEAARLIREIVQSLHESPNQFSVEVKVVGQQITANGGTGLTVNATGGEAGSTTIGNQVNSDGGTVTISQSSVAQECDRAYQEILDRLSQAADCVESNDEEGARGIVESLRDTWIPQVIVGVVSSLIQIVFGG